jgi:putative nucleotidyltransferase with HDIG domain
VGAYQLLSTLKKGGGVLERFWTHSIAAAVVSQELARLLGLEVVEEAFVAGLLHDVGKLVLAEHDPETAREVYRDGFSGPEALGAEHAAFGVNHLEVGEELARRWELADVLRCAVARHHRHYPAPPAEPGDRLAFLVGVAESLAHPLSEGQDDPRDLAAQIARVLRKPVGPLATVLTGVPEKIEEFAQFFEIQLDDLKTYTLWVEGENQRLQEEFERQEGDRRRAERRQAEMTTIREVHGLLLDGSEADAVVWRVLRGAQEAAGARRAVLARASEQPATVCAVRGHGDVTPEFVEGFRFPLAEGGVVAEATQSGQIVNVFDVGLPYFRRLLSAREVEHLDAPAFVVIPIRVEQQQLGVLYADRLDGDDPFSDEEVETLAALSDLAGLAFRAQ